MIKTITPYLLTFCLLLSCFSCSRRVTVRNTVSPGDGMVSNFWKNATVYFLLTDRFYNGDPSNDLSFNRKQDGAVLRNFEGGDLKGITLKIQEGYFDSLGVNAIWMTPIVEQIWGHTDEGTGKTYAYHGYWARDWTRLDPNFGTEAEFRELVSTAHQHGIRILMDVVVNHTGPVTPIDPKWPDEWVRTGPKCTYTGYESTVACTLVDNLPDIRTERTTAVKLPDLLREKWQSEGRLAQEVQELDDFFARTGLQRLPHNYIIKWLTDWVRELGIDGFRVDTAKHTEAGIWEILKKEATAALRDWKRKNPQNKLDDEAFYMTAEVYGFGLGGDRAFDYGDRKVDFFDYGFESLINFAFKADANLPLENLFAKYSAALNGGALEGVSVLNYISSHDDGSPFDLERQKPLEAATKLMLTPGAVQIYYGDETARPLVVPGAKGDANLRSFMNWEDIRQQAETRRQLQHWRKLGRFRAEHPAVGAGVHQQLQAEPYIFKRTLGQLDKVVVAVELPKGEKIIPVAGVFEDRDRVKDYYSGVISTVEKGQLKINSDFEMVLLGQPTSGK